MVKILQTGRSIRAVAALARIHRYRADRVGIARRIQIGNHDLAVLSRRRRRGGAHLSTASDSSSS